MAQIIWTEPALIELDEIAEYIAVDNPVAAQKLVRKVFLRVEKLKEFPKSGRKPPELPNRSRYREVIVGPCRVFYREEKSKILIIYLLRSERVLRKYILEDRG
ncbi:MAG: type II toxin-antitoxin system RelE/ParE family toxin [Pseudomonadales bacterium]|nr:type II toxin-antitoxin system RelE/ParE family toxin [Pseudomonadales bacterium]